MARASGVPAKIVVYQNNTQDINLKGLTDSAGNFINDATGTATLLDENRNPDPIFQGLNLVYVNSSNGYYTITVPSAFVAAVGTEYMTVIDGDGNGSHFHLEIPTEVKVRRR